MSNIGVLIETDENKIKAACLGVITAARDGGSVFALIFCDNGEEYKQDLQRYGVETIVTLPPGGPDSNARCLAGACPIPGIHPPLSKPGFTIGDAPVGPM